ncbi:virion structural protein [Pseudomonas phage PaMx11]|uniref:Virion structural protein n=1 Tax=Pseudomonas phage PaMx11 TaxID=1175657 RepID=A0A0S0N058_BPPAM|nr:tail assembly protein [Pseudomonas phage PaMx11]ALH23702.1 virion structural protein [Pseudomonas phage PaMx11]
MAVIETFALVGPLEKRPPSVQFSPELSEFGALDNSPPNDQYTPTSEAFVQVQDNLPISELGLSSPSWRMPSFLDDYYYRVHVLPGIIELGNLLSAQVRQVEVWSAYFEPQLLSSLVSVDTDGINLGQPAVPPTYFAALESRTYSLSISTNGAPVINAKYTFNFPDDKPTLRVTGRRVVVWPFMPQTKHRETLEWLTDVIPSFNNEQRLALRTAPRQAFTHEFQLDTYQFSRAKAIATQWAHRVYGIPVWAELTRVGPLAQGTTEILVDTTVADYRAEDIIIIWQDDAKNSAVEIGAVLPDRVQLKLPLGSSYLNAYVAPLRFARAPSGVQFKRSNSDFTIASAEFRVTANKDLGGSIGLPQYRGKDVLTDRTVLVEDLNERISRSIDQMDNGSGPISVDIKTSWVDSAKSITFDLLDRQERWRARRWLHSLRGKQRAFWLPTWNRDFILLEDVGPTAAALTVRPVGYPLYYGVKDIMVQLKNGTQVFSRVLSGATDPNGNEVLALEGPVGVGFLASEVEFICFLSHVRLNSDRIDIRHDYAGRAVTSIPVMETPE